MNKLFIIGKANDNTPEILVYGVIGSDENNSTDFVKTLKELEKKNRKINIRINSEGGSVLQGLAMYTAIMNSTAEINTYIDGFAGSMAADLSMAGKKVFMSKYARLMTHGASSSGGGNADALRSQAALLDSLDKTRCVIYANRTGKSPEQCMTDYVSRKEDKWFTAEEALAEKLVDEVYDSEPINIPATAKGTDLWSIYNTEKFAAIFNQSQTQTDNMKIEISAASKAALGIAGEVADFTALDNAIAQLKAKADAADTFKAEKDEAVTALATLKADNVKNDVKAKLDKAIDEKRITVAQKSVFEKQYADKPEELAELLATMQPFESKVTTQTATAGATAELTALMAKSGSELWKEGKLPRVKELDKQAWKAKYKEAFGEEPEEETAE